MYVLRSKEGVVAVVVVVFVFVADRTTDEVVCWVVLVEKARGCEDEAKADEPGRAKVATAARVNREKRMVLVCVCAPIDSTESERLSSF
jgi:hypothetical protein